MISSLITLPRKSVFLIYQLALEENLIFTRKWRPIITGIVNDKPCAPSAIVVIWSLWLHVDGRPSSKLPSLQPIWVLQVFSSQIKLTQSLRDHSAGFKWKLHFGVWFGNCVKLLGLLQFDRCIFFNFFLKFCSLNLLLHTCSWRAFYVVLVGQFLSVVELFDCLTIWDTR